MEVTHARPVRAVLACPGHGLSARCVQVTRVRLVRAVHALPVHFLSDDSEWRMTPGDREYLRGNKGTMLGSSDTLQLRSTL
jgi:hypothetical protein